MKALLGPLLAVLAVPALAASGSSASLTGLRYELIDLRPGDGIAPSVRFSARSIAESGVVWDFCAYPQVCQRSEGSTTQPAFSNIRYDELGQASGFAAVSPAGLFAAGQYDNGNGTVEGNGGYMSWARYQGVRGNPLFVLSAHTALRITAQYTLDAWVERTDIPGLYRGTQRASAAVFFDSRFIDGPDPFKRIEVFFDEPDLHETGEISALLSNPLDRTTTVWGRWGVLVDGQVPVNVPEPGTWALLLAGAGAVGGIARRRRPDRDAARPPDPLSLLPPVNPGEQR